jgi:hypothetical protein
MLNQSTRVDRSIPVFLNHTSALAGRVRVLQCCRWYDWCSRCLTTCDTSQQFTRANSVATELEHLGLLQDSAIAMDRGAYIVYANGHAWVKTDSLVTVRLKGTAPGFGPEARFHSEDGAAAILKALSKHCCFTRGVLEDMNGVMVTEATKHLDPGTYFYIPGAQNPSGLLPGTCTVCLTLKLSLRILHKAHLKSEANSREKLANLPFSCPERNMPNSNSCRADSSMISPNVVDLSHAVDAGVSRAIRSHGGDVKIPNSYRSALTCCRTHDEGNA